MRAVLDININDVQIFWRFDGPFTVSEDGTVATIAGKEYQVKSWNDGDVYDLVSSRAKGIPAIIDPAATVVAATLTSEGWIRCEEGENPFNV